MGYLGYFTSVGSKEIIRSPYNPRLDAMADRVMRGDIVDKNGNILAGSEKADDGSEYRYYPYGEVFAHVVGYSTQGKAGIESVSNFELLTSNAFLPEKIIREFRGQKNIGDTVVTTLDASLQSAAYNALGDNKGAVIVIEPQTGRILAEVSKPSFDPNYIDQNWETLNEDENSILLNRATQGLYAPGSTFKIVTTLEYMREHPKDYSDYYYDCNGEITYQDATIPCANHVAHGPENLANSFANSCNCSFCNIGMYLKVGDYQDTASDLLIGKKLPGDFPKVKSRFQLEKNATITEKMMTAMGQGKTLVSPYQMALVTCAIANNGTLMKPYLVEKVTNYKGVEISKNKPEAYKELMSSSEASQLKSFMTDVITYGTGSALSGEGFTVAGKTGTAEYGDSADQTHSWFVGFTNIDDPELAICVIVEESNGGTKAINVAAQVLESYYY